MGATISGRPHMLRTRRLATPLAAALLIAALGACGGDPEPKFEPTESTSPTPSDDTTTDAADVKEPWESRKPSGALAFAKHWTQSFSEAFQTGDASDFKALGSPKCSTCKTYLNIIDDAYSDGGKITGKAWHLSDLSFGAVPDTNLKVVVAGSMKTSKQVTRHPDGESTTFPAETFRVTFNLEWKDGAWITNEVTRQ
ncbi:DUF6318 family protein [Nocardioides acrostichi]|uniref:DUF6318 domain-containing protein n=1 Tax=Nocardioides acrostichi TaxID=2784339 RepID=A0A930Y6N0_9ACTN|nr:DUF6318 family protein [Nocardioides acrostichi]MBF4162545.1 hypothetical protein [Nocardioides acrostichi]